MCRRFEDVFLLESTPSTFISASGNEIFVYELIRKFCKSCFRLRNGNILTLTVVIWYLLERSQRFIYHFYYKLWTCNVISRALQDYTCSKTDKFVFCESDEFTRLDWNIHKSCYGGNLQNNPERIQQKLSRTRRVTHAHIINDVYYPSYRWTE